MDKQEVTLLVLLNLSATFDTLDHKTFLEILEIAGNAKKWISFFLSCRTQHILINQNFTKSFDIDCCGVPQGSCLGPILFIIYYWECFDQGCVNRPETVHETLRFPYLSHLL